MNSRNADDGPTTLAERVAYVPFRPTDIATKPNIFEDAPMLAKPFRFVWFCLILFSCSLAETANAGLFRPRARRTQVFASAVPTAFAPVRPIQNSFTPTPTVVLQGNLDTGPGYSPLGLYGNSIMANYGNLSVYRARTTNVLVRTRGYDGTYRDTVGTATTYPNFTRPGMISSPTRANNFFKPRGPSGPRVPGDAINWLDLN